MCVKTEDGELKEKKPKINLLGSLLLEDDDVLVTETYKRRPKEVAEEEIKTYREIYIYINKYSPHSSNLNPPDSPVLRRPG